MELPHQVRDMHTSGISPGTFEFREGKTLISAAILGHEKSLDVLGSILNTHTHTPMPRCLVIMAK